VRPFLAAPQPEVDDHVETSVQGPVRDAEQPALEHVTRAVGIGVAEERQHSLVGAQSQRSALALKRPGHSGLAGARQADEQEQGRGIEHGPNLLPDQRDRVVSFIRPVTFACADPMALGTPRRRHSARPSMATPNLARV
jgi:hypothetical protein